jgi:hypothetical protein
MRTILGAWALAASACGGAEEAPPESETAGSEAATEDPGTGTGTADAAPTPSPSAETADAAPGPGGTTTDARQSDAAVVVDDSGRIAFRADVQMELETLPGTSAEAVQKMGGAVQRQMTKIRSCYDRAVAADPEIQGVLKLLLETNARRAVSADVTEAGLERGRITSCVLRILRQLPRADLPASARLWVVLRASNTMAAGMREVREAQE